MPLLMNRKRKESLDWAHNLKQREIWSDCCINKWIPSIRRIIKKGADSYRTKPKRFVKTKEVQVVNSTSGLKTLEEYQTEHIMDFKRYKIFSVTLREQTIPTEAKEEAKRRKLANPDYIKKEMTFKREEEGTRALLIYSFRNRRGGGG